MKKIMKYCIVLYIYTALMLIFAVLINQRSYQDEWILDGILMPIMFFIFTFLIIATNTDDNRILAVILASFLIVLNSIPNLKYQLIYGTYDSIAHYGFINRLILSGHAPEIGFYAEEYSGTPGMHIFIGSLSLVSGIPVNTAIKVVLSIIPAIIPFMIYLVTKGILDENTQKFILVASSFSVPFSYSLTGMAFALPVYFSFLSLLFHRIFIDRYRREYSLCLILIGLSLIVSHGVTSISLFLLLIGTMPILKTIELVKRVKKPLVGAYLIPSLIFTTSLFVWWMYVAKFYFYNFLNMIVKFLLGGERIQTIPLAFFELSLSDQLRILIVRFSHYTIIVALSLIGLFVFVRQKYESKIKHLYFYLFTFSIVSLLPVGLYAFKLPSYTYERWMIYALLFSPFFAGLALWRLSKYVVFHIRMTKIHKLIFSLTLFTLISLSLIQIFHYQPLIPKVGDEYVVDYRAANTIYQKEMISFAEKHSKSGARIASDIVTSWQIFGLTDVSFSAGYVWRNPLLDEEFEADLILLHYSGKSGSLNEKLEYRTRARIEEFRAEFGNTIYDNGESFIVIINKPR